MLTREAIVTSEKTFKLQKVTTPEWALGDNDNGDAHVFVRTLGAEQAGEVQDLASRLSAFGDKSGEVRGMAEWCVLGVCDEQGEPLFVRDDIPALIARPLMPLQRCAAAIMEVNGITVEAETAQKKD